MALAPTYEPLPEAIDVNRSYATDIDARAQQVALHRHAAEVLRGLTLVSKKKSGSILNKALGVKMASKLPYQVNIASFLQNNFMLIILLGRQHNGGRLRFSTRYALAEGPSC